ncbi:MAG: mannose-1-phosphate guanylyltransferase/mannose-6-phosphate isomerase [Sinimarinibacterium flocculans]|uniref:mannose-1-phosphate guanylyltransferase/mannose-6-phosphate isomerase n=1 Tax=Sinimarinibacterium flocculans TaxID=985250 RepID=UPI003C5F4415
MTLEVPAAMTHPIIVPVILAGGSGTRLWPLSREAWPKQFLKIGGDYTLFQSTVLRARAVELTAPPVIICGDAHRFIVAEQLRAIGSAGATIILEPQGRNTAPAAAIAALHAQQQHGDDALVFLMSADHAVDDVPAFCAAARIAAQTAADGRLTVFGIKPSRAETGYGYLKRGAPLGNGAFELAEFVEKPDRQRAEAFVAQDSYAWNGGLFLFSARVFLEELARIEAALPERSVPSTQDSGRTSATLFACRAALSAAKRDLDFIRLDAEAFSRAPEDSIDYAVMERTDKAAYVPMDAGWDDVGAWTYLSKLTQSPDGNYAQGDVMLEACRNVLVHAEGRLVGALGVDDLVIVETQDAVLVARRDRVQDVRRLVARLREQGRSEAVVHPVVHRPWGSYETVATGPRFQVKRIVVKAESKLSLQMHHHRAEHWIVVCGTAKVTCEGREFLLSENQSTYIPLGAAHRLENPGKMPLELIEVQSGAYLGEDDIVRFDDAYGRA